MLHGRSWKRSCVASAIEACLFVVTLLLTVSVAHCDATLPSCKQMTIFQDCLNKSGLKVQYCELHNAQPKEYFECLCREQKLVNMCYAHCVDDSQLQLEKITHKVANDAACQKAVELASSMSTQKTSTTTSSSKASKTDVSSTAPGPTLTSSTKESTTTSSESSSISRPTGATSILVNDATVKGVSVLSSVLSFFVCLM